MILCVAYRQEERHRLTLCHICILVTPFQLLQAYILDDSDLLRDFPHEKPSRFLLIQTTLKTSFWREGQTISWIHLHLPDQNPCDITGILVFFPNVSRKTCEPSASGVENGADGKSGVRERSGEQTFQKTLELEQNLELDADERERSGPLEVSYFADLAIF